MATTVDHVLPREELREIPLSRIVIADGFNPRGEVADDGQLDALAETMRQRGCLQPIRVRASETGDYVLLAGERRYRAAVKAALTVLPAIVRPAGAGDDGEQVDLLADAVIENELRKDLDAVQRAKGYRSMIEAGCTAAGVAERLGGIPVKRVRDALAVLDLPADVQRLVADGTIPGGAVRSLARLGKVHPGLPAVAVRRASGPKTHAWDVAITWDDVISDPIAVVIGRYDQDADDLPAEVYVAGNSYPTARFTLDDAGTRELGQLCELLPGVEPSDFSVRLGREAVEQALALKSAHASANGYAHVIVGQDVADQLATDYIGGCLKVQRANAKRAASAVAVSGGEAASDVETEEQRKLRLRGEREERKAARATAVAFNEELGAAVFRGLAKVRVDDRVLKVLTAANLSTDLGKLAARGARYGLPAGPR